MSMNATELRAALAPSLKLFKALSDIGTVVDDVIGVETSLVALRKEHGDLTKNLATMKGDRDRMTGELRDLLGKIEQARADHKTADADLKARQAQLDKAKTDHDAALAKAKADHDKALGQAVTAQQKELDRLRSERAGVDAELTAAKNRLAAFHNQLAELKK